MTQESHRLQTPELDSPARYLFESTLRMHKEGFNVEAMQGYRRVLALSPDFADAHHNLGVIAFALKVPEEGIGWFSRAWVCGSGYLQFGLSYVRALCFAGRVTDAYELIESAQRPSGLAPAEIEILRETVASMDFPPTTVVDEVSEAFGREEFTRVLELTSALTKRYPLQPYFWKTLGSARQRLGLSSTASYRWKPVCHWSLKISRHG